MDTAPSKSSVAALLPIIGIGYGAHRRRAEASRWARTPHFWTSRSASPPRRSASSAALRELGRCSSPALSLFFVPPQSRCGLCVRLSRERAAFMDWLHRNGETMKAHLLIVTTVPLCAVCIGMKGSRYESRCRDLGVALAHRRIGGSFPNDDWSRR